MSRRRRRRCRERSRTCIVGADEHAAGGWHQPQETCECGQDRRDIGIDVGVIELDVVDDDGVAARSSGTSPSCRRTRCRTRRPRSRSRARRRADSSRRSCRRCRRPGATDRGPRASVPTRPCSSSWSCRACPRPRSDRDPTGTRHESAPAASSSAGDDPARSRVRRCRARSRCRPPPGRRRHPRAPRRSPRTPRCARRAGSRSSADTRRHPNR